MIFTLAIVLAVLSGCAVSTTAATSTGTKADIEKTKDAANVLSYNQATPTDLDYSLERYNLIRRAYWVNGQREKANSLVSAVNKPLGYIVLFTESGSVIGRFVVDGKVSSLNSFLSPNYVEEAGYNTRVFTRELPDIDGSYGENDSGIFFFTNDGKYIEWTGTYLYSDIPFEVDNPIIRVGG